MDDNAIIKKLDAIRRTTTSNDPLDVIGEELAIATVMKRYANKRYDNAIEDVIANEPATVAATKAKAFTNELKAEHVWRGNEYVVSMGSNAPVQRVDAAAFYNELIKAGVKKEIVDAAQKRATKKNAPATSFTAVRIEV